jgi:hypothetical protein
MRTTATTTRSLERTTPSGRQHRRNGRPSEATPASTAGESYDDWRRDAFSRTPLVRAPRPGWLPLPRPADYDW